MGRPRGASQSAGRLAELVQTNRDGVNLVVDLVMSDDDAQAALAVQAFLEIEPEGRFIDWLGVLGVAMARGPEA